MRDLAHDWYVILSALSAAITEPLSTLGDGVGIPLVSALLFGLIGATSPCQLTTGASALAYVARDAGNQHGIARRALAYVLGKAFAYTLIGVVVILAGQQVAQSSIPVIAVVRKVLGPLMILLGLYLLGLIPLRVSLGGGLAARVEARAGSGTSGAFLLGIAFSLAFCPTLFLLFFGLTIPLALSSPVGIVYPGIFAFGTAIPLLGLVGLLGAGIGASRSYLAGARRIGKWLRPAAAIVLVLAGLNDTAIYWFL